MGKAQRSAVRNKMIQLQRSQRNQGTLGVGPKKTAKKKKKRKKG